MLIYSVNVYYDNKAESLMSRSHLVARALVPSMQFDDYQLAENYLATLKAEDDVLNAFIFDENLKVYAVLNEKIDTDFNPNLFIVPTQKQPNGFKTRLISLKHFSTLSLS